MAVVSRPRRRPRIPAAFQVAVRRIEVDDAPMPWPRAGEVLIELTAVGICGSDLHYFRHGRIGPQTLTFPQILGHEPAGIVAALGRGVRGLREGQRVAVEPGIACGRCRPCRDGRPNLCYRMRFLGGPGVPGAFQQYLVMPAECAVPLPSRIDDALASATEPLGVALHALRLVGLKPGEPVGIIGAGPVGLSVLALARAAGGKVVAISDPRAARRAVARRLGAARTVEPAAFVDVVRDATGGRGADVVFECSGAPTAVDVSVAASDRGARVALVGINEVDTLGVDPHAWRVRELQVVQVRRSRHTLTPVLKQLAKTDLGLVRAGFFSDTVGLGGVQAAFEQLDDAAAPAVKILVDPRRV